MKKGLKEFLRKVTNHNIFQNSDILRNFYTFSTKVYIL
jgi:hypothetical protein